MSIALQLQRLKDSLNSSDRMPVVFLGHGSPMNAIEDNDYSRSWKKLGETLPPAAGHSRGLRALDDAWLDLGERLQNAEDDPRFLRLPGRIVRPAIPPPPARPRWPRR